MITMKQAWRWFKKNHLWRLLSIPRVLQVEVTNRCNSDCEVCPRKKLGMKLHSMTFAEFKHIIDAVCSDWRARFIPEFHPYRFGEPTLNKDLVRMCRYIKKKIPGIDIVLYTNGHRLRPKLQERLIPYLSKVVFSVEGFGEQYEKYRKGMEWDNLDSNISRLLYKKLLLKPGLDVMVRYTKYKDYDDVGMQYREWFPLLDDVIGRRFVEFGEQYGARLPCEFLSTHMVISANSELLSCCVGERDLEIGRFYPGAIGNLIKFWNARAGKYRGITDIDRMLMGCRRCCKDEIKADDTHD